MKKLLALTLALLMTAALLPALQPHIAQADGESTPLVVAYAPFSGRFSPFYTNTNDRAVVDLCSLNLLTTDRTGGIIFNAIEGETVNYNGTDYTYTGPADVSVKYDAATDTTTYTAKLRRDLKFSDGVPVTADDIIFTYYTYLDPSYHWSSSLSSYDIVGLQNYRTQTTDEVCEKYAELAEKIYASGSQGYVENDEYTEELYYAFWGFVDEAIEIMVRCICDYIESRYFDANYVSAYFAPFTYEEVCGNEGLRIAYDMRMWGFGWIGSDGQFYNSTGTDSWDLIETFPTMGDFITTVKQKYGDDIDTMFNTERTGNEGFDSIFGYARDSLIRTYGPQDEAMGGQGVKYIEGIKRIDDYTVSITLNGYSASAVYSILGIDVAPMHYYGDVGKYDYENGKFGFDFGDLSKTEALIDVPMGAGPYVFESYRNGVVTFRANPYWYKGEPKIKEIRFKETDSSEFVTALSAGAVDAGEMSGFRARFEEIASYNSNGEITGDVITTSKVDNLGYGYIGMNADNVNIGGEPDSAKSKALRKGLATVLAVYRDAAYKAYYGESASVIQYPISSTSWAAPQPSDPGYRIAFSVDANGNDIYTQGMTDSQKYEAAKAAALTWFAAAGYTVKNGKITAAPEGGRTEFEVIIPGDGQGDHPSYNVLTMAQKAFEEIGITLIINDPADSNVLWDALDAGSQDLWCAAWGSTIDPDMYQVYHGNNIVGKGGTDSNHYHINDEELNDLIMEARSSDNQAFRKATYKECLDIILDWAVEIPAYQRQNCIIFSTERVNISTLTPDITTFWGWMNDIENLEMKPLLIATQPQDKTVAVGKSTTFTVEATDTDVTYQWYYSKDNGASWTKWSGKTSAALSVKGSETNNGCLYRCELTKGGLTETSDAARLTVSGVKPNILTQPKAATVAVGKSVTFKVVAAGTDLSYQWYYSKDNGASWTKWSGKTAASVSVKGSATNNGCLYRCEIKNGTGSVTTNNARLTVSGVKPNILTQPKAATVAVGKSVTFKVVAAGTGLTYQWQYSKDNGASWTNWSGKTSASVSVKGSATNCGCLYRCVVKNETGSVTSSKVRLTVTGVKPVILTQPKAQTVTAGKTVTFKVVAAGEGLTYQWQYSKDGKTWTNCKSSGYNTATFSFTSAKNLSGRQYRCVVKNSYGTVNSAAAVFKVK